MLTGSEIAIDACDVHHQRRRGADGRAGHGRSVARRLRKDEDATANSSDPVAIAPKQLQKRVHNIQTFEVEHIMASRLNKLGDEEYRVRWKGFSEKDDTWEPPENFLPGVVEEFQAFNVSSSDSKYYRTCPKCNVSVTANRIGKHVCSESSKTETCPKCERTFFRSHFESHHCEEPQEEVASKRKAAPRGKASETPLSLEDLDAHRATLVASKSATSAARTPDRGDLFESPDIGSDHEGRGCAPVDSAKGSRCPKCNVFVNAKNIGWHVKKCTQCPSCKKFFSKSVLAREHAKKCPGVLVRVHRGEPVCDHDDEEEEASKPTFQVDCIIASRLNVRGHEEYRVRWKGFSEKDDTWEPPENFLPGVVDEFKAFNVSSSDSKYYRTCPKCNVSITPNNIGRHVCSKSSKTETCPKCERTFFVSHIESHLCEGRQEEVASKGKAAAVAKAPRPPADSSHMEEEASKQVATVGAKPTLPSPVPSAVRLCT
jgi:hypothetical protein